MSVKTFNFTNRAEILSSDALITVQNDKDGFIFNADLRLNGYNLPGDARVFVEAHRQTQYMRFDFGHMGSLKTPVDRKLRVFDSIEGVLFRVKVVTSSPPQGLLLAVADQIRPINGSEGDDSRISLLVVRPSWDLGDEIWGLDFDTQDTRILVNATLGNWQSMARDPAFISLVYPSAFRTILWRILRHEGWSDSEDLGDWRSRWLFFAKNLSGVGAAPSTTDDAELEDWIDTATAAFCQRHNIRSIYEQYWMSGVST